MNGLFTSLPENLIFYLLHEWVGSAKDFANFDTALTNKICRRIYLYEIGRNFASSGNIRVVTFNRSDQFVNFKRWIQRRNAFGLFSAFSFTYQDPEVLVLEPSLPMFLNGVKILSISSTDLCIEDVFMILNFPNLNNLTLENITIRGGVYRDLEHTSNELIQTLSLVEVTTPYDNNVMKTLCAACPNTTTLTIILCTNCTSFSLVTDILPSMPSITELTFCSLVDNGDHRWRMDGPMMHFPLHHHHLPHHPLDGRFAEEHEMFFRHHRRMHAREMEHRFGVDPEDDDEEEEHELRRLFLQEERANARRRVFLEHAEQQEQRTLAERRRIMLDMENQERRFFDLVGREQDTLLAPPMPRIQYHERARRLIRSYGAAGRFPENITFPRINNLRLILPTSSVTAAQRTELFSKVNIEEMFYLLPSMNALHTLHFDWSTVLCREQLLMPQWDQWLLVSDPRCLTHCEITLPIYSTHTIDQTIAVMMISLGKAAMPLEKFSIQQRDCSCPEIIRSAVIAAQLPHPEAVLMVVDDEKNFVKQEKFRHVHDKMPEAAKYPFHLSQKLEILHVTSFETFQYSTVIDPLHLNVATHQNVQDEETVRSFTTQIGIQLFASLQHMEELYYPLHQLRILSIELKHELSIPYTMNSHLVSSLFTLTSHLLSAHSSLPLPLIERIHIAAPHISFHPPPLADGSNKNELRMSEEESRIFDGYRDISSSMIVHRWRCHCPHLRECTINLPFYHTQREIMTEIILPRMQKHCPQLEFLYMQVSTARTELIQFTTKAHWEVYWQQKKLDFQKLLSSEEEDDEEMTENDDEGDRNSRRGKEEQDEDVYEYDTDYEDEYSENEEDNEHTY